MDYNLKNKGLTFQVVSARLYSRSLISIHKLRLHLSLGVQR